MRVDEGIQCYHGDLEFNDMLTALVEFSKGTLALLAGGLSYLALPLDLVPDFIPVAGWMDDAALLGWIFTRCADEFKKYGDTKNPPTGRKAQ